MKKKIENMIKIEPFLVTFIVQKVLGNSSGLV